MEFDVECEDEREGGVPGRSVGVEFEDNTEGEAGV
jgi:hypothetical protein